MPEFIPGTAGSIDTSTAQFATQITGLKTGAPVALNSPVSIRADGKLYPAGAGSFVGISPRAAGLANQGLTVYGIGTRFHASDGGTLVPGKTYFVGLAAGTISDTATVNDAVGAFVAVTVNDLMVVRVGIDGGPVDL